MKKRVRKDRENISHRGNNRDLLRKYQMEMDMVHNVAATYYTSEGEVKKLELPATKE